MARRVILREEHLLGRPLEGTPLAHVTLQGSQHAVGVTIGMVVLQFAQQRDGHQLGRVREQGYHFGVPDLDERIGARTPISSGDLRRHRHSGRALDATRATLADAGLGRSQLLRLVFTVFHVEANLVIGE